YFTDNGIHVTFAAAVALTEQHRNAIDKEHAPQAQGLVEPLGQKWLDGKTVFTQSLNGMTDRCPRFGGDRREPVFLEITHAQVSQRGWVRPSQRNRCRIRIAVVRPCDNIEQHLKVTDSSGHWPYNTQQREWANRRGEVTGCRYSTRGRLQAANPREMRRHPYRAASITADSSCRQTGRDGRRFSATGA